MHKIKDFLFLTSEILSFHFPTLTKLSCIHDSVQVHLSLRLAIVYLQDDTLYESYYQSVNEF